MTDEVVNTYAKRSEGMIRPSDQAIITVFGSMLGRLPLGVQKHIMESSAKNNPQMGFIVDPYAFFTCHEITDLERAQRLLPDGYRIVPSRIFADGEAKPYLIFGAFTVQTSAFSGSRVEMYIVAEHIASGLLSWVIADYDTNTLSFDPGQGMVGANADRCVVTTTHRGKVLVDVTSKVSSRRIAVTADVRAGVEVPLDQRLWIEGNLSIGYGGELDDGKSEPFGVLFEPGEMEKALRIPMSSVEIEELTWHEGLYDPVPTEVACFPYAQHFITSGVPMSTGLRTHEDLDRAVAEINAGPQGKGFESSAITRSMLIGAAISNVITWSSVLWILVHLWTQH